MTEVSTQPIQSIQLGSADSSLYMVLDERMSTKFVTLMNVFSMIKDQVSFMISAQGLRICEMDGSHIILAHSFISRVSCENFGFNHDYCFNLNLEMIKKMKIAQKQVLHLEFTKTQVIAKIYKAFTDELVNQMIFPVLAYEYELSYENMSLESMIDSFNLLTLDASDLKRAIDGCKDVSEVMNFALKDQKSNQLLVYSENKDSQYFQRLLINIDHWDYFAEGTFSIQFMKIIQKSLDLVKEGKYYKDQIRLGLKSESPLYYQILFGETSFLKIFLAPRVEEDSDSEESED